MKKLCIISVTFILLSSFICLAATENYPEKEGSYIKNGSVENGSITPKSWNKIMNSSIMNCSNKQAYTGNKSLMISTKKPTKQFSCWYQTIYNVPIEKNVVLKCFIKTESLDGAGAAIAIRGDDTETIFENAEIFSSTEGSLEIVDTNDWKEYSVKLYKPIPPSIKCLTVYLIMLPETKGTVYFDEISLEEY